MTQEDPIDISVLDAKELKKIKEKKKRADRIMKIIREKELDKDKSFMDEIEPLIEELLK